MNHKIFLFFILFCLVSQIFCAESTTPEPYDKEEFPEFCYDIRRTEIITFGSLPFVTMGVTTAYGAYEYVNGNIDSFPNPLDKSTNSFTSWQQLKIFGMSLGVSTILGLTDFCISKIKYKRNLKRQMLINQSKNQVRINTYSQDEYKELLDSLAQEEKKLNEQESIPETDNQVEEN